MHRTLLVCLGLAGSVNLGCSSSNSPPDSGQCVDLTQLPTSPPISFKNDIMPIFGLSCIASSCHDVSVKKATLELGDATACDKPTCYDPTSGKYVFPSGQPTAALVNDVLTNLVNVPSKTIASVPRVKPGDPAGSFLMDKLLDTANSKYGSSGACQNQDTSQSQDPCGTTMPIGVPGGFCASSADSGKVQTIAMWIQQGAANN